MDRIDIKVYKKLSINIVKVIEYYTNKKIKELDIEYDKNYIIKIFLNAIKKHNKEFNKWNDEDWIKSMEYVNLGFFSFILNNNITLKTVYEKAFFDKNIQTKIFIDYQTLLNIIKISEQLSEMKNVILKDTVDINNILNKKHYLFLNLSNVLKDGKVLASIIDILSYSKFRSNLIKEIFKGMDKISLNKILDIDENSYDEIENFFEYLIKNNLIIKFVDFCMMLNLEGEILAYKNIYKKTKEYIDVLFKESDLLKEFSKNLNKSIKKKNLFKEKCNIKFINEEDDFKEKYYFSSKNINNIDFDFTYNNVFVNNVKIYYDVVDLKTRFLNIILFVYEIILLNKNVDNKIENMESVFIKVLSYLKKSGLNKDDNFNEFFEEIKKNGVVKYKKEYKKSCDDLNIFFKDFKNLLNQFSVNDSKIELFINLLNDLEKKLKSNNTDDRKEDKPMSPFSDFFNEVLKDKELLNILLKKISNKEFIEKIVDFVINYKKSLFEFNPIIKNKMTYFILLIIERLFKNINNEDINKINYSEIFKFIGKQMDMFYFYKSQINKKFQKKIITKYK